MLQGIPYLKECACSRLQSWYRDETKKIDTDLQKFVDNAACCTEYRDRSGRNTLKRVGQRENTVRNADRVPGV